MIAVVDYGLGNIRAFANVFKSLCQPYVIARDVSALKTASRIVLPGVGAFDYAMERLIASGMRDALEDMVLGGGMPVLGVCVGMQILARSSEEGSSEGLGWIAGSVRRLGTCALSRRPYLPHMGWNALEVVRGNALLNGLPSNPRFYFLHSYYFECDCAEQVIATTEYGSRFTSAVNCGNIYGVQFHPERSHGNGMLVLKNFGNL